MSSASRPTIMETKRDSASRWGATSASNSAVFIAPQELAEGRLVPEVAELHVLAEVLRRDSELERLFEVVERRRLVGEDALGRGAVVLPVRAEQVLERPLRE